MEFIECIETLKRDFSNDCCVQDNGTLLLGLQGEGEVKLPRKHVIFPPLPSMELEWNVHRYKRHFPEQLKQLLVHFNGFNLFSWHLMVRDTAIVKYSISIYGFQTIEMRDRKGATMLIPYDISTEDLRRPKGCPETLLRVGSSDTLNNAMKYIFIDTETDEVLMSDSDVFFVIDRWSSLDECLINLYNEYSNR